MSRKDNYRRSSTQPRVSRLLSGAWQEFNIESLLTLAARAGLRTKVLLMPLDS